MFEFLVSVDRKLFFILNGCCHSAFLDQLTVYFSGNLIWLPLYVAIIIYLFKFYNWKTAAVILLAISLCILIADQTSVHLFKNVFQRLRPCHDPNLSGMVITVNGKCGGRFGFVSSHAANCFAVFWFLSLFFGKKWITVILFFWAVVVSFSRVFLGVHFPADIIGGGMLGIITGSVVYMAITRINRLKKLIIKK